MYFKREKQQEGLIELIAKQPQEQNAAKILQAAIRRKPMRDFIVSDLPVEREHNIKQKEYAELLQKQKKENEEKLKLDIVRYNQQYKMDQLAKQKKAQEQERQQAKNKQAAITIQNAVRNKSNEVAGRVFNKEIDELATKKKVASVLENALARPFIRSDIFKALQEEKAAKTIQMQLEMKKQKMNSQILL